MSVAGAVLVLALACCGADALGVHKVDGTDSVHMCADVKFLYIDMARAVIHWACAVLGIGIVVRCIVVERKLVATDRHEE